MKAFSKQLTYVIALSAATLFPVSSVLAGPRSITEFSAADNNRLDWQIVNDGVMGGLSKGNVSYSDAGSMRFRGTLSLENNGGFSSVRSTDLELNLSDQRGLVLRVRGDGRKYQLRLSTDQRYRSSEIGFKAEFPTTEGQWNEVRVPFGKLIGGWRGRLLEDRLFDPSKIERITILLGDKQPGPFQLEVDWIRTYDSGSTVAQGGSMDLLGTALADGRFKTLATALTKAELVAALQGEGPFTVFAPTDEAFAKLPKEALTDLLKPENKEKLQGILKYHVVAGKVPLSAALQAQEAVTLQGDAVRICFSEGRVQVNEAGLIDADVECSNGVIHVIDSILLPPEPKPKTIMQVAEAAGNFSALLKAIDAAGLSSVLEGEGPFTVFAPTDDAVGRLPEQLQALMLDENRDQLKSILTYHVVSGRLTAGDALNAGSIKTVNGRSLEVAVSEGRLKVNDSIIQVVDLTCENGVIHVIDSVLLPSNDAVLKQPTQKQKQTQAKRPSASDRILAAIDKGVPLYNHGNPAACAEVYANCVKGLSNDEDVEEDLRVMLASVLNKAKSTRSVDARAWLLRRALDGTLTRLQR